jgi:hypothetical protein
LRRRLCSADRLSESAMARGLSFLKTLSSSVRASLVCVTRFDQRRLLRLAAGFVDFLVLRRAMAIKRADDTGVPGSLAWQRHRRNYLGNQI